MKNWDDARYLLAAARYDTFSAAATSLGVNQTTVSRRIERLEAELGLALFTLNRGRLEPTASGVAILEDCKLLERAANRLDQRILAQTADPIYRVTVATTENVSRTLLMPNLDVLQEKHTNIRLTVLTSQQNVRLDQGDADIAVRLKRPRAGRYKVRKLMDFDFAIYASSNSNSSNTAGNWLSYSEDMSELPEAKWMTAQMKGVDPVLRTNDVGSLAEAAVSGAGIAMLPCRLGDRHPGLTRLDDEQAPVSREAWLLIREDVQQYPQIRIVADWVVEAFAARAQA